MKQIIKRLPSKEELFDFLRIATEIIPKVPSKDDNRLTQIIKTLGIADSILNFSKVKKDAGVFRFFDKLKNAQAITNRHFVDLFFGTKIKAFFKVTALNMGEHTDVLRAHSDDLGTLYFVEYRYGAKPEYSNEFWVSIGFDFERTLNLLWGEYNGRIHLDIVQAAEWGPPTTECSALVRGPDPLFGEAVPRLEAAIRKQKRYLEDKVPRTYLFLGEQGTGKTTFALMLAEAISDRVLRIEAEGLTSVGANDLDLILDGLKPEFIIIDDIDRAPDLTKSLARLFAILTSFKDKHPKLTIIMTANDISKLDGAFRRPGRIDEVFKFKTPTPEERKILLEGYLKEFKTECDDIEAIVAASADLTPAYLREFALQFRYETQTSVLEIITQQKELYKSASGEVKKGGPVPKEEKDGAAPEADAEAGEKA